MAGSISKITILLAFSGVLLSGCATWPSSASAQAAPSIAPAGAAPADADATAESDGYGYPDYSTVEPAAGPAPATQAAARPAAQPMAGVATAYPALVDPVMAQRTAALQNEVVKLEDRLQRVEKAALRLDRRMQLVERNELSRMHASNDGDATQQNAANDSDADLTASNEPAAGPADSDNDGEGAASVRVSAPRTRAGYGEGFQPVSVPITSALQAAPSAHAQAESSAAAPERVSEVADNRLPSLADPATTSSRAPTGEEKLAIWTVHYSAEKVWPERDQLPYSRDVVSLLREGGKATLFARGAQPNSREFRERVKALSRYLSKVTSLDSVPIAALAAPHLDGDTIEIVAQP